MSRDHASLIIAIDFDGTCVTHDYPDVGREIGAAPVIKALHTAGHRIVLFTMRSGAPLEDAVRWFRFHDIPLFGINSNPEQHTWTASPKPYAHIYIDDAALGVPLVRDASHRRPYVDWEAVGRELLGEKPKRAGALFDASEKRERPSKEWYQRMAKLEIESGFDVCIGPPPLDLAKQAVGRELLGEKPKEEPASPPSTRPTIEPKIEQHLTLTVEQIADLAEFAGLTVARSDNPDELEVEIGVAVAFTATPFEIEGKRWSAVAWLIDEPGEGCLPLGKEVGP